MASRMLKFVDVTKRMPDKRDAELRRGDFDEIFQDFSPHVQSWAEQRGWDYARIQAGVGKVRWPAGRFRASTANRRRKWRERCVDQPLWLSK